MAITRRIGRPSWLDLNDYLCIALAVAGNYVTYCVLHILWNIPLWQPAINILSIVLQLFMIGLWELSTTAKPDRFRMQVGAVINGMTLPLIEMITRHNWIGC